jgi:hypothetical protein
MKKRIFVAILLSLAMAACEKTSLFEDRISNNSTQSVPPAVLKSLGTNFGNVTVTEWKLRSDGSWRAHFIFNGVAWEATFSSNGTLIKSEPA